MKKESFGIETKSLVRDLDVAFLYFRVFFFFFWFYIGLMFVLFFCVENILLLLFFVFIQVDIEHCFQFRSIFVTFS